MSISFRLQAVGRLFSHRTRRTARRRALSLSVGTIEGLEKRLAMTATAAATPAMQILSATTTDSKSVTIEYQVNQAHRREADPVRHVSLQQRPVRLERLPG